MLKLYNIGIVSTYEIQEVIEAKSLKEALALAEERYYAGCYMSDDDEAFYHAPKFYDRYLDAENLTKEEK
jgi:hypothetical protein